MLYSESYQSPIGKLVIVVDETNLLRLDFEDSKEMQKKVESIALSHSNSKSDYTVLKETKNWLDNYFNGKINTFLPAIKLQSSPFRMLVWNLLLDIPYGKTCSYGELGAIVAKKREMKKMSAQAIGQAVGKNPISIIIPCHRVVGYDGKLTGYGGGIEKKKFLLELERNAFKNL